MDGTCDWGDTPHARNHIITTLQPPSTIELCDQDYAPGLIPLLAANLGVDPQALYTVIEKFLAREARKADKELADVQAAAAAEDSQQDDPTEGGHETFHDVGIDLRAERKHGDAPEDAEVP